MLQVDVRELRRGPVATTGSLHAKDPLFEGLEVGLEGPVTVGGTLEVAGSDGFMWRGRFEGRIRCTCRRCLCDLVRPVEAQVNVLFSADPALQEDPSVYPLPEPVTHVDVRPAVREELALVVNAYPLCRDDCRGLCQRCGAELNRGACNCPPSA